MCALNWAAPLADSVILKCLYRLPINQGEKGHGRGGEHGRGCEKGEEQIKGCGKGGEHGRGPKN